MSRFARRAQGQHAHAVTAINVVIVPVLILIVVFDLQSASDRVHARIPSIYIAYLAVGIGWYKMKPRRATPAAR